MVNIGILKGSDNKHFHFTWMGGGIHSKSLNYKIKKLLTLQQMFANCQIRDFFAIHLQLPNQRLFYFIIQIAGISLVFGGVGYKISNLVILIYLFSYCNHVVCVAVVRFNFRYQTYFFLLQNLSRSFQSSEIFAFFYKIFLEPSSLQTYFFLLQIFLDPSSLQTYFFLLQNLSRSFQSADIFLLFTESFQIVPDCRHISSIYRIFLDPSRLQTYFFLSQHLSRLCSITKDLKTKPDLRKRKRLWRVFG